MSHAKRVLACALAAVAISACASNAKPVAGQVTAAHGLSGYRGKIDDPRLKHARCLQQAHIAFTEPTPASIQVGPAGVGPLITFLPTTGSAQSAQIAGSAQPAEVIGSALLYPNQAPDGELTPVENCIAIGVKG